MILVHVLYWGFGCIDAIILINTIYDLGSRSLGLSLSLSLSPSLPLSAHPFHLHADLISFQQGMVRIIPLTNEAILGLPRGSEPLSKISPLLDSKSIMM